jgi:uncharacterized protein (TIGR03382 family)
VLAASAGASAAFTGISLEFSGTTATHGPGFWAVRVFANFSNPGDRLLSVTGANYTPSLGHVFYQNPFGGATEPNPALIPVFPDLAWDTFVTIGSLTQGTPSTALEPGSSMTATSFTGGYFIDGDAPQGLAGAAGKVLLAQLTIQNPTAGVDVMGSMTIAWKAAGGSGAQFVEGAFCAICPAPGALALLGLAGLAGGRRRR